MVGKRCKPDPQESPVQLQPAVSAPRVKKGPQTHPKATKKPLPAQLPRMREPTRAAVVLTITPAAAQKGLSVKALMEKA